jgi:hypothetical protein
VEEAGDGTGRDREGKDTVSQPVAAAAVAVACVNVMLSCRPILRAGFLHDGTADDE